MNSLKRVILLICLLIISACNDNDKALVKLNNKIMAMPEASEHLNEFDKLWQNTKVSHQEITRNLFEDIKDENHSRDISKEYVSKLIDLINTDSKYLVEARKFYGSAYAQNSRVRKVASHIILSDLLIRRSLVMLGATLGEKIEQGADVFAMNSELQVYVNDTVASMNGVRVEHSGVISNAMRAIHKEVRDLNEYFKAQFEAYGVRINGELQSKVSFSNTIQTIDVKPFIEGVKGIKETKERNQTIEKYIDSNVEVLKFTQIEEVNAYLINRFGGGEFGQQQTEDRILTNFLEEFDYNLAKEDFFKVIKNYNWAIEHNKAIEKYISNNSRNLNLKEVQEVLRKLSESLFGVKDYFYTRVIARSYRKHFLANQYSLSFKQAVEHLSANKSLLGNQSIEEYFLSKKESLSLEQFRTLKGLLTETFDGPSYDSPGHKYDNDIVEKRMSKTYLEMQLDN